MKKAKALLLILIGLVAATAVTLPFWGPKAYGKLKRWVAQKHTESSQQLEEVGHLASAIERTRAAHKLAPEDLEIARRLGRLLEKQDLQEAIRHYEKISQHPDSSVEDRLALTRLALRSGNLNTAERQLESMRKQPSVNKDPEFHLLAARALEARGQIDKAIREIRIILSEEESELHQKARYSFVRLAIRSDNPNLMQEAKDTLNLLSLDKGPDGIEAIRFYFGISGYTPAEAISILQKTYRHPAATLEDKLEAATLCHNAAPKRTVEIINELRKQFDLSGADPQKHYLFCRWLGRIRQWEALENYLQPEHALLSPQLYTLRLDALANLDRWERLAQETTNRNAPISNHFRMLFRTRALAKLGDEKRAREHLDRLVKEVGNDRDTMLRICEYLEKTRDVPSLTYLLHRIVETDPLLEPYAFRKLLVYERDTAALEQICFWYEKLHDVGKNLQQFRAHKAYYDLLAGINLGESTLVARSLHSTNPEDLEARILVALTHLRSDDPDPYEALRILETTPIPNWDKGRLGWKIIYSYILQKTSHPDKAEKLLETIATAKLSRAEREGIEKL